MGRRWGPENCRGSAKKVVTKSPSKVRKSTKKVLIRRRGRIKGIEEEAVIQKDIAQKK